MAQSKSSSAKRNTTRGSAKNTSQGRTRSTSGSAGKKQAASPADDGLYNEIAAIVFLLLAVFIIIGFFNQDGVLIVFISNLFKGLLGWGYWLLAPVFLYAAVLLGFNTKIEKVGRRVTASLLLPIFFAAIGNILLYQQTSVFDFMNETERLFEYGQELSSGGVLGGLFAIGLKAAISIYGAVAVLIAALIFLIVIALNISLRKAAKKLGSAYQDTYYETDSFDIELSAAAERQSRTAAEKQLKPKKALVPMDIPLGDDEEELFLRGYNESDAESQANSKKAKVRKRNAGAVETEPDVRPVENLTQSAELSGFRTVPVGGDKPLRPIAVSAEIADPPKGKRIKRSELDAEAKAVEKAVSESAAEEEYEFPPFELLNTGISTGIDSRDEILANKERLEGAISSFGISAVIVGVTHGPTVTRYDIELDQGVKLARVTNLAGDLALALGVVNVRIAPITGKISTVGIEVPNKLVSTVYLRDIIDSPKFASAKSKLTFAIGKDIGGDAIVGNIAKLPHMLIAGTTGSGKSVCMNSLIISLLYKSKPEEVRLIMIDPKMVELGVYNGIPHLYVPVVTDPKKAAGALQWSVVEMLKRYRLFSEANVRDLENYNKHCISEGEATLPQVVIVIDELADLMLVASKEVEESICRVAQMGRAAGMHLIIATQRPSADVITGLMKANIPSRIAFAVSSAMESRIILDQSGAEKLIGMGDMLFSPVGCGKPTRIQGAFVSDEERENVIQFIKEGAGELAENPEIEDYMNKALESKSSGESSKGSKASDDGPAGDYDEMLPQAVQAVLELKACSVSMLQRRVKLGYSRAARIVDQMEELGIVGPYEGAKPRKLLIDKAGWRAIQVKLGMIDGGELPEDIEGDDSDSDIPL